ncbi:CDGSH iron-sulfur domain-containing protein [Actinomadura sp. KC345]|nr:CDGSH iron-sulfur domain-containing protein [Actinomadura sp. KC345]
MDAAPREPAGPQGPDARGSAAHGSAAPDDAAEPDARRVRVVPGGPVLVEGPVDVVLEDGRTVRSDRFLVALCACRRSRSYPFCDTSHRRRVRTDARDADARDADARDADTGTRAGRAADRSPDHRPGPVFRGR